MDTLESRLSANLAANLRAMRERRGLTQAQVAELCGLPRTTLCQIETGAANPTLGVLARLSLGLRLSIEELLTAPHAALARFPRGTLPTEKRGVRQEVSVSKLLPDPIPGMEIDRLELPPGARMSGIPHRAGTREYLTCERGTIALTVHRERLTLAVGDVAAFRGDQPHAYHNPASDVTAVGFSVVTFAPLLASPPS